MRIRLLRPVSGIGDMIRCTAVATAIRKKHPNVLVDMVSIHPYATYAETCPDIHRVIRVEPNCIKRDRDWRDVFSRGIYTHTVNLYCPAYKYERENWPGIFKDRVEIWTDEASRVLEEQLEPCAPVMELAERHLRAGRGVMYACRLQPKDKRTIPVVGVIVGSTQERRRFNAKQVMNVTKRLKESGCEVFGLSGGLTSDQLLGVISQLDCLVTTDTGPMHIAGALGIPAVCVASTTEGKQLTKWYPSVSYLNAPVSNWCNGHCYYVCISCMSHKCLALEAVDGELIAEAAIGAMCGDPRGDDQCAPSEADAEGVDNGVGVEDVPAP